MGCVQPSKADAPDETAQVSTQPTPAPEASTSAPPATVVQEKKVDTVSAPSAADSAPISAPAVETPVLAASAALSLPVAMATGKAKIYIGQFFILPFSPFFLCHCCPVSPGVHGSDWKKK
jgi:hypothetical protein